jgi:hypothetical protein
VQKLLSPSLLSKNVKIKIHRTITLPVVMYGCETLSLTFTEGLRLRVFESRVLRRIFGLKTDEVTREWKKVHNDEFNDMYYSPKILRMINSRILRWAVHVAFMRKRRGVYRVMVENLREIDHLGDPGVDGRIILRGNLRKWNVGVWTGSSWLRIGTVGGYLRMW